jgi:hypothetical protein
MLQLTARKVFPSAAHGEECVPVPTYGREEGWKKYGPNSSISPTAMAAYFA